MNKAILIGRICTEVENRQTQSGKTVASYRLAVDRQFKQDGQPEADFLNCVAFGNNGDFASRYLHKGIKIAVEGRIQTRTYDDKDGKKVYVTEIIVERQEFCEKKAESSGNSNGQPVGHSAPAPVPAPAPNFEDLDPNEKLPF